MNHYPRRPRAAGMPVLVLILGGCTAGGGPPKQTCARAQLAVQAYEECLSRTTCHTTPNDTFIYHQQGRWLVKHCTGDDQ